MNTVLASSGHALPEAVRASMERRFGHGFGDVRIHHDARAAESAAAMHARAWTVGSDIAFGSGQFAPHTPAGARLLAHELAHVVQQGARSARSVTGNDSITIGAVDDPLEREAETAARQVAASSGVHGGYGEMRSGVHGYSRSGVHSDVQLQRAEMPLDVVQRHSISPQPRVEHSGEEDADPTRRKRRADEAADVARAGNGAAGIALSASSLRLRRVAWGDDPLGGDWSEKHEAAAIRAQAAAERECLESTGPDPAECDPAVALTWTDFTGTPANGRHDAATFSSLQERPINVGLLRCTPRWAPAGTPARGLQAVFDPARSWVRPKFVNTADPAQNGCANTVAACETHFDREAARGHTDVFFRMSTNVRRECPSSAIPRGDTAHSRDDCATVVAADCADRAAAESSRLLRHEQGHFDLTCAMARKANQMLGTTTDFDALLRAARAALRTAQARYDAQTRHGCNPDQQSAWETAIAAGLPAVTIAVRPPRRSRR